jgi:hypothetical protein|tara:strand:- start:35 stop:232 length:198 start_codon:yes stop_codon:yes gene_type:complete
LEQRELLKKKIADDEQKVIDEELKRQNSTSFKIKVSYIIFKTFLTFSNYSLRVPTLLIAIQFKCS